MVISSLSLFQVEARFAVEAVRAGCALAGRVATPQTLWNGKKPDGGLVGVLDYSVQAEINARLEGSFPDDPVYAEEGLGFIEGSPDAFEESRPRGKQWSLARPRPGRLPLGPFLVERQKRDFKRPFVSDRSASSGRAAVPKKTPSSAR